MITLPESTQNLIWSHLEGKLTEEEELSLQDLLKSDPAARKFYLRCSTMQSILHWEHSSIGEQPSVVRETICKQRSVVVPIWKWVEKSGVIPIGIAAGFIGAFSILGLHFLQQEDNEFERVNLVEASWSQEAISSLAAEGNASLVFGSAPTADDSEGLIVPVTRGGESGHSLLFNFETPDHRKG